MANKDRADKWLDIVAEDLSMAEDSPIYREVMRTGVAL